ncbi:alpha-ketoglutarate-dependent dioxygenase alkB homolog 4 [Microplitis mediator]|uniref:alpha-ketoglutarate-dependent dioxygenase alkB homolog 4 n=1 Tax=Microplitis mediator TaxID=375433 RepID=UPI002555D7AF|nr:alpha-ketoglutarate-dependent dioxygenase alkB homolog 4 [Microplitis mediator]
METVRPCGCKGIRTCLICEEEYKIFKSNPFEELRKLPSYVYCPECDQAWPGWDINIYKEHPNHTGNPIYYSGVYIKLNFLSEKETNNLITDIDNLPWDTSQSGRRKQNYGPKCNFKKRRLSLGNFNGFPITTKFIQKKLSQVPLLEGFKTIEQCSLEYTPERGASIDPHIDDCWIWGERIVTVNVTGDSVLTMSPYQGSTTRYNLDHVSTYSSIVPQIYCNGKNVETVPENAVIRLPMPAKSLIVLYGNARYNWEHAVLREDIQTRRVCIAYREFTPPYLPLGLHSDKTEEILMKAQNFW